MRYQKPVMVDLAAGARATGQWPLQCRDGAAATGPYEYCAVGTGAGICGAGSAVKFFYGDPGDCLSGVSAIPTCASGTNPTGSTCDAGSSGMTNDLPCVVGSLPAIP
ncbi:MAG: hypothetical protein KKA73_07520 [Chloroflexi bacterium]|nr:hypothetical protein [Chloroflexota bacterium]MBU1747520.1 hypothetical protein [Chloroflexota bacterium]